MAQPRSIPQQLEKEVLERAGNGESTRAIAAWLKSAHKVQTTFQSVARFLKDVRIVRADVAKGVVRAALTTSLTTDIECLEKHRRQLDELADKNIADPKLYCLAVEQLRKVIDTKLHYSGADAEDEAHAIRPVICIPPESDD